MTAIGQQMRLLRRIPLLGHVNRKPELIHFEEMTRVRHYMGFLVLGFCLQLGISREA